MFHPRSNIHTHTNFSDGKNTVDEMIQAALQRGFTSLGFSDHGALSVDNAGMMNEAEYRENVRKLHETLCVDHKRTSDRAFEEIEKLLEPWRLNRTVEDGALDQILKKLQERNKIAQNLQIGYEMQVQEEQEKYKKKSEAFYRAAVLEAKEKYADRIEIALGYEHDFAAVDADLTHYDYILESVHFLHKYDKYWPIDSSAQLLYMGWQDLYGENTFEMCRDYYEDVSRSIEKHRPDVVGHIGLITKFIEQDNSIGIDESDWKYKLLAMDPIETAAKYDTIVEINTGAMSRGYRTTPYPSLDQLKRLHELGGHITITSDCHRAEWIDFAFYKAVEHAKAAGFTTVWIWEDGQFREKPMAN